VGKLAFLFPGQGSQKVGMGAELREADPELFDRCMDAADAASSLPVKQYATEGPMELLTRTDVAQPALFALSLALAEAAGEEGLRPDFVAGHSLGEYTAAVAAGALGRDEGMRLVSERGRLMAGIQDERPGAMAAVMGLESARLAELCEQASADAGSVALANLNSPTQIVVSGEEAAVERLVELAKEAGAARALRLQVGAAFHSTLMEPVQARLREVTEALDWSDPSPPLVSNASGQVVADGEGVRQALVAQIASPVLWVDCVRTLLGAGVTRFVEVGPGRVLSGLVRQIAGDEAEATPADSRAKLAVLAGQ
jgi:[acyl-carrier-protein] S-malonyltransferase